MIMPDFEKVMNQHLANIMGLPLLTARLAQKVSVIKNDPLINTELEINEFLIKDLTEYRDQLKSENCLAHLFINDYINFLINEVKSNET